MDPRDNDMTDDARTAIFPAQIEATVEAIARLHAEHDKRRRHSSFTENPTARAGQSTFIAWLRSLS
jgi:hypothetical protein